MEKVLTEIPYGKTDGIEARTVDGLRYVSIRIVYGYLCTYTLGLRTKPNAVLAVTTSPVGIVCTYHYNVYGLVESTRRQRTSITSSNLGHRRQIRPPPICQQSRHSVSINSWALWLRRGGVAQVVRTQFVAMQVMQLRTTPALSSANHFTIGKPVL